MSFPLRLPRLGYVLRHPARCAVAALGMLLWGWRYRRRGEPLD